MPLRKDAVKLSTALNQIVDSAKHSRSEKFSDLASRMAPLVSSYDRAVFDLRSREAASDALADVADAVSTISEAAARREVAAFDGDAIRIYWRLYTIFREPRYDYQTL